MTQSPGSRLVDGYWMGLDTLACGPNSLTAAITLIRLPQLHAIGDEIGRAPPAVAANAHNPLRLALLARALGRRLDFGPAPIGRARRAPAGARGASA